MATANNNPVFPLLPVIGAVTLAAANTARDGSGSIATLLTGDANSEQVKIIRFSSAQLAAAANSAMVVRVWLSLDGGTTWYLFDEANFAAVTASNTVKGQQVDFTYAFNFRLTSSNMKIGVTKSVHAGVQDQLQIVALADNLGS